MKTAAWLALLAVGAILAIAVHADLPGSNLQVVGVIIMLTGRPGADGGPLSSGRRLADLEDQHGHVVTKIVHTEFKHQSPHGGADLSRRSASQ